MNLGGFQDWRLPTLIELVTLVDYSIAAPGPSINAVDFSGTPGDEFWTSTPLYDQPSRNWIVSFAWGYTGDEAASSSHYVRCVRGGVGPFASAPAPAPASRYDLTTLGGIAAVYDVKTKLTWEQTPSSDAGTFPEGTWTTASSYCAGKGSRWRLPTVEALLTLVDFSTGRADPAFFPNVPINTFWTSTPVAGQPSAWEVDFNGGLASTSDLPALDYVRCVYSP